MVVSLSRAGTKKAPRELIYTIYIFLGIPKVGGLSLWWNNQKWRNETLNW